MTKPIEGWVIYYINGVHTDPDREEWIVETKLPNPDFKHEYRPVKITFMDNTARDLIEDGLEDDTIATTLEMMRSAVMMDRERIWEELMKEQGIRYFEDDIKKAIFWEEK